MIPDLVLSFKLGPRQKADWLRQKEQLLSKNWLEKRDGKKLLKKISAACNLKFPNGYKTIKVTLKEYSVSKYGDLLGFVDVMNPRRITLYVKKTDKYSNLRATLCHELIHCLIWSNSLHDNRRISVSLFADIFADELITTLLEELIIKERQSKVDFEWAFDYARTETYERLKRIKKEKEYSGILEELKTFLSDYKKAIKNGSNAIRERQRALKDILIPIE